MSTSIESLPNDNEKAAVSTNIYNPPPDMSNMSNMSNNNNNNNNNNSFSEGGGGYESENMYNNNVINGENNNGNINNSGVNQSYNLRKEVNTTNQPRESASYLNYKRNNKNKNISKKPVIYEAETEEEEEEVESLPSRDIPIHPLPLNSDQEVIPSFIKNESQEDYIRNFENIQELKEKAKKEEEELNSYEKYFSYILVVLIYIFLQLPIIKNIFRYNLPKMFSIEGIPNFSYHVLSAIILGGLFFVTDTYVLKELKFNELLN